MLPFFKIIITSTTLSLQITSNPFCHCTHTHMHLFWFNKIIKIAVMVLFYSCYLF